jgi:hemoglobin/transferrin/lactoferrin receptor protein
LYHSLQVSWTKIIDEVVRRLLCISCTCCCMVSSICAKPNLHDPAKSPRGITDNPDTIKTILLNSAVVVSAQRSKTESFDRSESIGYLSRARLRQLSPMNTPQALANVAGVWMQKTNHGGGSAFVRGLTGYQTLLLVDGIRMNNSTYRSGPNQYLNTIDPLTIHAIEVLRGSGSVQYGSDAIGGTIHILSKSPSYAQQSAEIYGALYGKYWSSDMERTARAEMNVSTNSFAVQSGLTYKKLGDIEAGGDLGMLSPTGYDEYSFDIKGKHKLGKHHELIGGYQHLKQQDVPLYHKIAPGNYTQYHFDPQQRDFAYLRMISNHTNALFTELKYTASYQRSLEVRKKQKTSSTEYLEEKDIVNTLGLNLDMISNFSNRWQATTGIEYYHDHVSSTASSFDLSSEVVESMRGLYPDGSLYDNWAVFTMHEYKSKKLSLVGGLRYNLISLQLEDTLFGNTKIRPDALVWNVGVVYNLSAHHHLTGTLNSAFRAPNINDVSSFGIADFRYEVPAYDLQPETSLNKELGYKFQSSTLAGAVHIFHQHLDNLIANVPAQFDGLDSLDRLKVYRRENVNKAYIYGGELEFEGKFGRAFEGYGNLSYTYGQNESADEPLRRIPPLFGRAGIRAHYNTGLELGAEWVFAGEQNRLSAVDVADERIASGGTPAWSVANIYAGYRGSWFGVNIGFENIFDEAYRVHGSGVDGIGRSVWVALQLFKKQ